MGKLFRYTRLAEAIPDVEGLRTDPQAYFATRTVMIRQASARAPLMLAGLIFGFVFAKRGDAIAWDVVVWTLPIALICAEAPIRTRRGKLECSASGAQFYYGKRSICVPWSAFDCDRPESVSFMKLILPLNAEAAQRIERFREGAGVPITLPPGFPDFVWFAVDSAGASASINGPEVEPLELANLLRHIGRAMPADALSRDAVAEVAALAGRRVDVPFARLKFPPACCGCGSVDAPPQPVSLQPWGLKTLTRALIAGAVTATTVPAPICPACRRRWTFAWWMTIAACTAIGWALTPLAPGAAAVGWPPVGVGALVGIFAADRLTGPLAGSYASFSKLHVSLKFRRREYAEAVKTLSEAGVAS